MGLRKRASKDAGDAADTLPAAASLKGAGGPPALIDAKSRADYKKEFDNHRLQNKHATEAESLHHVNEYIKRKIDGKVHHASGKRKMDIFMTGSSVMCSSVILFSGIPVVVAGTVMECLNFSVALGLIPMLNVRTVDDLKAMASQLGSSINTASKFGLMAGVEAAVLDTLKMLELGNWLWDEILKDILAEVVTGVAFDSTWVMNGLFAVPKYKLHRHLIKKMNRKLGDKAHVVHYSWTEHNCVSTV